MYGQVSLQSTIIPFHFGRINRSKRLRFRLSRVRSKY